MIPTNLNNQLIRDEGLRLFPYTDTVGKLTIGVGRNLTDKGITPDEAEFMLSDDIAEVTAELSKSLPVALLQSIDPIRLAVLVNMAFNIGVAGLLKFSNTLALVTSGDYAGAADAMLESQWAKQVGSRAQRLSEQMRTGQWV